MCRSFLFGIAAIGLFAISTGAATIYVPDDHSTIQGAIDASANGDIVIVRPGTYVENIDFVGKAITVQSEQGVALTTIDGNQAGSVVVFRTGEDWNSRLDGFTTANGSGTFFSSSFYRGGGIYCAYGCAPIIENNTITGNTADQGGGSYGGQLENNIVTGNTANSRGGGIDNAATVKNSVISNNIAYEKGGGIHMNGGPGVENCIITGNMADYGGGICCSSKWFTPTIEKCTIVGNLANYGGGICAQDSWPSITGSILWDNSAWNGPELYEMYTGGFSVTYSDVKGGCSGTGNINADPLFVDPANGDYHLQQDPCQPGVVNPCVDSGHPNTLCEGTTRTDGVRDSWPADMGYHYPAYSPIIIYLPDDYSTIQGAINTSADGDTIIVRPDSVNGGPYMEIIDLKELAITLKSEKGAAVTTIDGHQAGSVVTFGEGCGSVLDGFTLTNGRSNDGGGIYCDYPSEATITNSVVSNNTASSDGGGIYCYGSDPVIENCIVTGNMAFESGGGIYCLASSATLTNITISGNTALDDGGGIYCNSYSSPVITNMIVWDNSAWNGPEIYVYGLGDPDVTYSDVKGGWPGTGNIDADPLFADASGGDYHITALSPCLDSGDDSVVTQSIDFEGDPRIALGVAVDMGADEYWFHLYHSGPVIPGSSINLKVVGWPTAPVTLALADSTVDPPTPTPHGDLYLPWPPLWSGNIENVPANGILTLPVTVPSGWITGDTYYLQALVGPWGGPLTLLTNLEVLTVE